MSWVYLAGILFFAGSSPVHGQSSSQLRSLLNRLTGEWVGDVSIHSLDGRDLGTYTMRRNYAWSGDVLEWESVLLLPSGEHTTRGRYFVRLGRLYATVARPGQPAQDYTGEPSLGGVFWVSALRDNRDLYESVVMTADLQSLELDSYEVLGLDEFPGVVRIKGALIEVRPEEVEGAVAREVDGGTEWLDPSDPIDLLRTYAPAAKKD